MPKKVELEINRLTSFGFIILTDKEYNDLVKQLQTTDKESLELSYCADGDDYYVDFEKTPAELLNAFNKAEDVSEEDYQVFKKHGCLCGSDIAGHIWEQIDEELGSEDDEDIPDDMKGDLPLGTECMYNGRKVRLVEVGWRWRCSSCVLSDLATCDGMYCLPNARKDGKSVHWEYVEE